jgi:hypothetical protein
MELCPFCNGNKKNYYISFNHDSSEIDLDGTKFDRIIEAETGDLECLKKQVDLIIGEK